ncbi:MAG TPA: VOC family protein [Vicinamibacterales bacterium]|nr:VOC family protein [Vicinamibacterales bacterium]
MAKKKKAARKSKTAKPARKAARAKKPTKDRRTSATETLRLRAVEPTFTVGDLSRSIAFYTNVLGFVLDEEYKGPDGKLAGAMVKAGVCRLGLSQDDWAKGRDRQKGVGVRVWCTTVQDIDSLAARIRHSGHTLAEEPKDQPWGGRTLGVDDPDGFHITVYRR